MDPFKLFNWCQAVMWCVKKRQADWKKISHYFIHYFEFMNAWHRAIDAMDIVCVELMVNLLKLET